MEGGVAGGGGKGQVCDDVTPDLVEVTPDLVEVTADLIEVTPDLVEVTPDLVEVTADLVEVTPDLVEVTPDLVEVTPDLVEVTPDLVEVSPDLVEVSPDLIEVTPDLIEVGRASSYVDDDNVTPVFLLAAGLGTRLRPLTDWLPKPLLPVGDRPALARILEHIRPIAGSIVANVHHRAADVRAFLANEAPDVRVAEEPRILGTAGGLANADSLLGAGDVLVWNGDILSNLDPVALIAAHRPDAQATLATRPRAVGEGNVGIDAGGRIVRLRKETVATGEVAGGEFLGVHVVGEGLRGRLPAEGCLVGDVYLPALRAGQSLRTFEPRDLTWHDIGTLADYEAANLAWLRQRGESSFVGAGASIKEGVTLRDCIVGGNAKIEGEGVLTGCIVWPDARVTAPCAPSVVTPWGVVPFKG